VSAAPKAGEALPPQCSFLKVDAPNVRVTALKRSEDGDGVMVRLVEMEGRDCTVRLDFGQRVKTAHRMDIIETEVMGPLAVEGNAVTLSVGHHAIETVKVSLGGSRRGIAGTRGF
jgi:alpha-mannosidase